MSPDSAEGGIAGWDISQAMMEPTTNEQLELIAIAGRLGSCIVSEDEPGIANEKALRNEAKLLMSLSCKLPTQGDVELGPKAMSGSDSVASSQSNSSFSHSSGSSRRSAFSFTCPSLSLETHVPEISMSDDNNDTSDSLKDKTPPPPAELLGRKLTMDDRDAMRLSAEAIARNVMQSYQKAMDWRLQCWMDQLSTSIEQQQQDVQELIDTPQVKLLIQLSNLQDKVKVLDASTSFKLLKHRTNTTSSSQEGEEPSHKKLRLTESTDSADSLGLQETDYTFTLSHALMMEGNVTISTPAGRVQIDLQVPGSMEGTFHSPEEGPDQLVSVQIDLRTDILASMIEKSSRMVVRTSTEALLKPQDGQDANADASTTEDAKTTSIPSSQEDSLPSTSSPALSSTTTPKRKFSDERVSDLVVVTPRDTSSPSTCGDSSDDQEDSKPVLLSIPDDFSSSKGAKRSLRMVTPQPSRFRNRGGLAVPFPSLDGEMIASKPSFEAVLRKTTTQDEETETSTAVQAAARAALALSSS